MSREPADRNVCATVHGKGDVTSSHDADRSSQRLDATRGRTVLVCLLLFAGTVLLFSRTLKNGFVDLDDPDYVTHNAHVRGGLTVSGLRWALTSGDASNWHPLTWISHMVDYQLFGDNPRGHHATSVLLHATNAVLAFLMLRRLTGAFWASAFSAALFAWHPLRVESVAWVAERKDVLSVCFGLLTLWAYAIYAQRRKENQSRAARFYAAALVAFVAGLFCKPMLVTVPFLLLLLDWWPLGRVSSFGFRVSSSDAQDSRHGTRNTEHGTFNTLLWEKLPFILFSVASCVITYLVQKKSGAVVENLPFGDRLVNAAMAVTDYLKTFAWPFDLAIGYPRPAHWMFLNVAGATTLLLAITACALAQRRQRPWLLCGWCWFLGMLVPVIGLVQVGLQASADRYTYLPILGIELALVWMLGEVIVHLNAQRFASVVSCLLLVGLATRTWNQLAFWKDSHTLYEHARAVTKNNYLAESYLGTTLVNENRFAEASGHLRRAIELKPDFTDARYRLGVALDRLDKRDEAAAIYQEVLKTNPGHGMAHYSLGALLLTRNEASNAIPHFLTALKIKDDYDPAYLGLGSAMSELGRPQEAIPYFEKALVLNPTNAVTHYNYANALIDLHREQEALPRYERALQLDPDFAEAHCNYANALRALNRLDEACVRYRRTLALRPDNADAHYGLGAALEDQGHIDEAIAQYQETLRLQPDYADANYEIGAIRLEQNQPAEAIAYFRAAIQSRSNYDVAYLGLGLATAQLGKHEEAAGYYERAIALNPRSAEAFCCLGIALRNQGKVVEAISPLTKALELKPDYAEAHAELGYALSRTGHPAESIPHFEQALKLHQNFPGVPEALAQARQAVETRNQ